MKPIKIKNIYLWILLTAGIIIFCCSCKKYENDEHGHLSTAYHRLHGTWRLQSMTNITYYNYYNPSWTPNPASAYTESFDKDFNYSSSNTSAGTTYQFSAKSAVITFHNGNPAPEQNITVYVITKLTKTELWYTAKGNYQLIMECHCVKIN